MASAKQNSTIWMGAYILTGGTYKPFYGYPIEFNVWNIDIEEQADFLGSANTQTLSGFERGNPMGFRTYANLDLDNSYPSDSSKILTLLNLLPSQYNRIFANKKQSDGTNLVTTSVLTSTTFTSAGLGSLGRLHLIYGYGDDSRGYKLLDIRWRGFHTDTCASIHPYAYRTHC